MAEHWRPVRGFEDYYEVSDRGRVRSLKRMCRAGGGRYRKVPPRVLRHQFCGGSKSRAGGDYVKVSLSVDAVACSRQVHILVLEAFVGLRPQGTETRHLNGNPRDNRLVNLEWGTPEENRADMVRHDRHPFGSRKVNAKLSEASVRAIRAARANDVPLRELARQYRVDRSTIRQIFIGRTWSHV